MIVMEKTCKFCGTKLSDFYETSMLGCEHCYEVFSAEITAALKKMQGKTAHVGKAPKLNVLDREMLFEYKSLLKEKEKAVLEGRFEEAAALDKDISALYIELSEKGLK